MVDTELYDVNRYAYINSNGTYISRSGKAKLVRVIISGTTGAAGNLTIYDNSAGSGSVVAKLDVAAGLYSMGSYEFNLNLSTGLTVVAASISNAYITVVYK